MLPLALCALCALCAAVDHRAFVWNETAPGAFDALRVDIGAYPVDSEFGQNNLILPQAVVGLVRVPAESTVVQGMGLAGYTISSSPVSFPVASFGFAGLGADGARGVEAHQSVITNCEHQACDSASGYHFGDIIGHEIDVNVKLVPGGTPPRGNVFGLLIIGASETKPLGECFAINIQPHGLFAFPAVPWTQGVHIANGAVDVAMSVGTTTVHLATDDSAVIEFRSRGARGEQVSSLRATSPGHLVLAPASGKLVVQGDRLQLRASGAGPCETGEVAWSSRGVSVCVAPDYWATATFGARGSDSVAIAALVLSAVTFVFLLVLAWVLPGRPSEQSPV